MDRREFVKGLAAIGAAIAGGSAKATTVERIVSVERGDRGIVYDADGKVIDRCRAANLSTGECVVIDTSDSHDHYRKTIKVKAPLTFVRTRRGI